MFVMHEKFEKLVDSRFGKIFDRFGNSLWYSVAIGAVCILCHSLDIPVVGAALLTLLLVPALLFCKNSFVLAPFLMMCSFVMSEETKPQSGYFNSPAKISVLCVLLVFIVAALIFNIIYYGKWKQIFKKSYLTVSLCLLSGALIIGGLGAPSFSAKGLGMAAAISLTMFLPYSLMINCGEYEGRRTVEYFAWAAITAATVIFAAVIKQYIIHGLSLSYHPKNLIVFGYAISNTAAAFVVIAMPVTFYMAYKYKHGYLFLIAVAMELVTVYLTYSRASLLVALPGTVIVATALCFKKKTGRIGYWIVYGLAVAAAVAVCVYFRKAIISKLTEVWASIADGSFTGSGRVNIWRQGFEAWKGYPIFGLGIWYLPPINNWYYSFHCTPLTYLYCAGLLGLAAYIYHRYKTVRLVFSAKLTSERVFVALAVLAMLLNALIDIGMTMPQHLLYYGIMLALIDGDVKKKKAEAAVDAAADISAPVDESKPLSEEIKDKNDTTEITEE